MASSSQLLAWLLGLCLPHGVHHAARFPTRVSTPWLDLDLPANMAAVLPFHAPGSNSPARSSIEVKNYESIKVDILLWDEHNLLLCSVIIDITNLLPVSDNAVVPRPSLQLYTIPRPHRCVLAGPML
ncbi:hypothetical protein BDV93DRAFT_108503 [Ceratobasidium sp. AG-I]|nr:hypothetical protein BDV93DRAFT_108503 [Ceratobasidium sp. AG-I]